MRTVLLIDDDPQFRALVGEWLAESGWQVIEAEDGEQGLNLALKHRPEIVLCDLLMPRCNGFQVCRTLRENRAHLPQTKIIVTTGSAYATDRLNALEAGADEYITKPVIPADLARLMHHVAGDGALSAAAPPPGHDLPPQAARLKFWGVRGSIPAPGPRTAFYGGNTPCVEIRTQGEIIILDAGTGIRPLGLSLAEEFQGEPLNITVLISHAHWDHIQGFPFFLPAYESQNKVRVLGYEGARRGLQNTLANQMESPYFPIGLNQMPANVLIEELKDFAFTVGPVSIKAEFVNHPGICAAYRIRTPGGDISYVPDVELFQRLRAESPKQEKNDIRFIEQKYAQDQDDKLVEFVRDSEVLIIDAQYDAAEYKTHVGWGHSCVEDSIGLAIGSKVKRVFLFHHDPAHGDEQISRFVAHGRELAAQHNSKLIVEAAREELEVVLEPASKEVE